MVGTKYRFGRIEIDGRCYTRDVIVLPDRVVENWWRREGHRLCLDDLAEVPLEAIDVLVIGTGSAGAMRVPQDLVGDLEGRGLEVIVLPTAEAAKVFDQQRQQGRRVAGAFHLTC